MPGSLPGGSYGTYWLETSRTALTIDLPPLGFHQIDTLADVMARECPSCIDLDRVAPAGVYVADGSTQLPFYAYGSVIWTPLNDPEFIAAIPLVP